RQARPRGFVGAGARPGPRAGLLGRGPRRSPGVAAHRLARGEERPLALADRVALSGDRVLRRVLDLADPLRRDRVQAHQDLGLALELAHRAAVAPDVGGDLLAGQRRELSVEAAEADHLDVLVRIPAFLLGDHARE